MTEKENTVQTEETLQEAVQASEQMQETAGQEQKPKEKTAEELALEQGYYACCFRSH